MEMEMERAEVVDEVAWAVERNSVLGEFSVDDLLDFGECIEAEPEEEEAKGNTGRENSNTPSSTLPSEPPQLVEIISADDVAALEWVSHFVDDDSFSEYNNPVTQIHVENQTERPSVSLKRTARFLSTEATVPAKAKRSKRSRAGRVWFISGPPTISESDSSTTTTTTSSSSSSSCLTHDISDLLWGNPPPTKKQKQKQKKKRGRKPKTPSTASSNGDKPRCTCRHCGVQETPQWRAGPDGPKTLCNACGVRFKSGRLLPEYRPACSPTFVSHVHSNSHRKVLEMRRKNLDPPVPSS